jgi:hypothetical protein
LKVIGSKTKETNIKQQQQQKQQQQNTTTTKYKTKTSKGPEQNRPHVSEVR